MTQSIFLQYLHTSHVFITSLPEKDVLQPYKYDMGKFWKFQSDDKKAPQSLVPSNVDKKLFDITYRLRMGYSKPFLHSILLRVNNISINGISKLGVILQITVY